MAMDQNGATDRFERQLQPARFRLAGEEFFQKHGVSGECLGIRAGEQRKELVAQREQAARLEADDGRAALYCRRDRRNKAGGFTARLLDHASGEKGAAAAEWTLLGIAGKTDPVAAGCEQLAGGRQIVQVRNSG